MKYSCIGVFKHSSDDPKRIAQFEERVVVTEASSKKEAETIILSEFKEYATDGTQFLDEYEINEIYEDEGSLVTEVASSMKTFDGTDEEYLDKHWYDQKPLSCENVGWQHVWHNRDGGKSGCYNCQEERDGELWKKA